jgi:hypothetical protein
MFFMAQKRFNDQVKVAFLETEDEPCDNYEQAINDVYPQIWALWKEHPQIWSTAGAMEIKARHFSPSQSYADRGL